MGSTLLNHQVVPPRLVAESEKHAERERKAHIMSIAARRLQQLHVGKGWAAWVELLQAKRDRRMRLAGEVPWDMGMDAVRSQLRQVCQELRREQADHRTTQNEPNPNPNRPTIVLPKTSLTLTLIGRPSSTQNEPNPNPNRPTIVLPKTSLTLTLIGRPSYYPKRARCPEIR
jgi:hypothetical protein